ncbi:MAG: exosortase/archaeosortase family protein, partial [Planctomycetota bacterium]
MSLPLRKSWTAVDTGLLGLLMVVWVCAFRHALIDVLMIGYRRQEQSHIILVPIVALWLLWIRRSRILSLRVSRSLWGPAIVALGIGAWAAGMAWDVQVLWHLAPVISLVGVVASLMGLGAVRRFAPVFGALLFLVPVPGAARQALTLPLQSLAAMSTEFTLSIMGVDAIRAANQLAVNGIPVEVGEEC